MLLALLILAAAPATDSVTCGATKFTLTKPAQAPAKPKVEAPPKPKVEVAKAKPKPKPIADCDKPKKG